MAPFGKIISYPDNYRVKRALAVAALNNLEIEVDTNYQMGVTNKTPEFLAKHPLGKVPVFESADNTFFLADGLAIARHVADSGPLAPQLLGADARTRAKIDEWCIFSDCELSANVIPPVLMAVLKMIPFDEKRYDSCAAALERALKRIDVALQSATPGEGGRKYLVGDKLTLADVMVAGVLIFASKSLLDQEMAKAAPSVEGYLEGLLQIPELKKVFGEKQPFVEKRVRPE